MGRGYWGGFAPYVTKAQKLRRADKARAALEKKGIRLEPVIIQGRTISRTWWGKAWAANLERYADYSNRIPRGRTYVRSGSVLDLKMAPNKITALVSGTRSQPYEVTIGITSLDTTQEESLMRASSASLHSLHDLLAGKFPEELKDEFFKKESGLFPSPREIKLDCSCPDWAEMCKHVAAALYGVAARLDSKPELFFVLRGIDMERFVGSAITRESEKMLKKAKAQSERVIAGNDADMAAMFGIEMDSGATGGGTVDKKISDSRTGTRKRVRSKTATKKTAAGKKTDGKRPSGKAAPAKKTPRKKAAKAVAGAGASARKTTKKKTRTKASGAGKVATKKSPTKKKASAKKAVRKASPSSGAKKKALRSTGQLRP